MASRKTAAARVANANSSAYDSARVTSTSRPTVRRLAKVADTDDRPAGDSGRGEQDGHEEQSAAEEDGREEAVLALTDLVPDDSDEPQEHDPGERRQVQPADDAREVLSVANSWASSASSAVSIGWFRRSTSAPVNSSAKRRPATLAAHGARSCRPASSSAGRSGVPGSGVRSGRRRPWLRSIGHDPSLPDDGDPPASLRGAGDDMGGVTDRSAATATSTSR